MLTNNLKEITVPATAGTTNKSDNLSDFIIYLLPQHSLIEIKLSREASAFVAKQKDNLSGECISTDYNITTERLKNRRRDEKGMKSRRNPRQNRETTSWYIKELTGKPTNTQRGNAWIDYFNLKISQKGMEDEL